jgi:aminoglycoside phosphotransferase (APT) family kinase protein
MIELTVDEVTAYVRTAADRLPWPVAADRAAPVPGGERHSLVALPPVGADRPTLLLRVPRTVSAHERAKAGREARALATLPSGVAPHLYLFDEAGVRGGPTLVTELVAGEPRRLRDLPADRMAALGRAMAAVHAAPVPPADRRDTDLAAILLDRTASEVDNRLTADEVLATPATAHAARRLLRYHALVLRSVVRALATDAFRAGTPALSHGDLGEDNILWHDGTPVLVDWEDARTADAGEEIAYLFAENGLSTAQRAAVRTGYERAAGQDPGLWRRVDCYLPLVIVGSAAWWLVRWARRLGGAPGLPHDPEHYREQMRQRLRFADAELAAAGERAGGAAPKLARLARDDDPED